VPCFPTPLAGCRSDAALVLDSVTLVLPVIEYGILYAACLRGSSGWKALSGVNGAAEAVLSGITRLDPVSPPTPASTTLAAYAGWGWNATNLVILPSGLFNPSSLAPGILPAPAPPPAAPAAAAPPSPPATSLPSPPPAMYQQTMGTSTSSNIGLIAAVAALAGLLGLVLFIGMIGLLCWITRCVGPMGSWAGGMLAVDKQCPTCSPCPALPNNHL
jgi:hypothetical protein